jgi:tetratricopeptide (TPR) repeat protein
VAAVKNEKHLYQSIYQTLPALLILLTIYTAVMTETALAQNSAQSKIEAANREDFFGERFREGRNLIDKGEWARAAKEFREAVEKYPDHREADAALYWLAFCYKKQKMFKEADAALNILLEKFSSSSWAGDARVMKTEIAPSLGRFYVSDNADTTSNTNQGQFSADLQEQVIKRTINNSGQNPTLADKLDLIERVPLDRADEIKLAAFQSLLIADPQRAIATMGEILKPDSNASEILKQEFLRIWRNPRLFASQMLTSNITKNPGKEEFISLLRGTLIKSFQNETNQKIRKEIIYSLASIADGQTTAYLKKLYVTENDREIKKAVINSLGSSENIFYALSSDLAQGQKVSLDLTRQQMRKVELDILLEIVRAEKDTELRRLVFSNLCRFPNWWTSEQAVDVMTRLYDAETDEEFKLTIIRAFAESRKKLSTKKLLDIAKNDKSDRLRLEAIYSLRTSKDPEVIKFLEDLIK